MGSVRHFFTNIICGFVPDTYNRKKLRVVLNSNMVDSLRFIRKNLNQRLFKVKTFVGHQARNLIIGVNNKYIYKFPLRRDNSRELALREKRVVDVFAGLSPIYVPPVELFEHRGNIIRKYEYIHGCTMRQMPPEKILENIKPLSRQVARFLYEVASSDPDTLRDLKPSPDMKPGFMVGWCQGDICDNFIMNPDTMEILAFIDWEDCAFINFSGIFHGEDKSPQQEFMQALEKEYIKLYNRSKK